MHSPEITPNEGGEYSVLIDILKTWNDGKPACTCDTGLDMVYDERLQKYICVNSAAYNSCPDTYDFATRECPVVNYCEVNGKKTDDCTCPNGTELMSVPGTADKYCYTEEMKQNYNTCVPYGQWKIEEQSCFCNEK